MVRTVRFLALATAALIGAASAHSGGQQQQARSLQEIQQRRLFMTNGKRALKACENSNSARQLKEQAIARRAAKVASLQEQRQQRRRLDFSTALATDHESSRTDISAGTDPDSVFSTDVSCLLEPEVTQGPYYITGELIRNDVRETQSGLDIYVDLQFVDINTCEPVEDLYIDYWHANATGVYSGIVANGNGDDSDTSNLNTTFLRGVAPTDSEGVVEFVSIFPGHYEGRATHLHLIANYNGTVLENGTYANPVISHVGQLFFDQDLLTEVAAAEVYNTNTQTVTLNADDKWLPYAAADEFDPIVEYVFLGDSIEDGLFVWSSIGVDMTAVQTGVTAAGAWTANGGVVSSTSVLGQGSGMGGSGMGSGMFQGGSGMGMPNGSAGSFSD